MTSEAVQDLLLVLAVPCLAVVVGVLAGRAGAAFADAVSDAVVVVRANPNEIGLTAAVTDKERATLRPQRVPSKPSHRSFRRRFLFRTRRCHCGQPLNDE